MPAWSNKEIELVVLDYFSMFSDELAGRPVNKAEHRRALLPLLNQRSQGSIEFKHQNISAVLINLGQPYIKGYLPRFNYQLALEEYVIQYLKLNKHYEDYFKNFADKEVDTKVVEVNNQNLLVQAPEKRQFSEPSIRYSRNPIKVNYLLREQVNQRLGELGEKVVLDFEKWKLNSIGKHNLADSVEWISHSQGDGAGFDILSKYSNGTDKYIEVKTTKLGKETPFFFSRNEMEFSVENTNSYHLYRLFDFDQNPRMFIKNGDFNSFCNSVPTIYKGYF